MSTVQTNLQVLMPSTKAIEFYHIPGYTGSLAVDSLKFAGTPFFITDGENVMLFEFVTFPDYLRIYIAGVVANTQDYYAILADGYDVRYDGPRVQWGHPHENELLARALEEVVIPEARKANIKGISFDSELIARTKEWMKVCVDRGIVTEKNGAYGIPFTSDFSIYTLSEDDVIFQQRIGIDDDLPF